MNCKDCPYMNLDRIIISTVKRTIEELGLKSKYIYRQDIIKAKLCSLSKLLKAEEIGQLTKIKEGNNTSHVKYEMAEFERFLNKSNIYHGNLNRKTAA